MVPTLTTERLSLRGWRSDDAEPYAEIAADTEVMRFVGGALEPPDAWRQLAVVAGHWVLRGYGLWAVEREGELVGRIGLWRPEGWPGLELGWLLARPAWGHGYATEAARAAMQWAWSELDTDQLISIIAHENVASLRVAERLGMRPLREGGTLRGDRVTIHGIDR
jgi:RimJ/RimL family protein N-acetyltransferase